MKINLEEVTIVTRCPFCGKAQFIAVNEADYWDWQDGELAQNAFPYLSADQREAIISGICPDCWESMFGGYNDEEDEEEEPQDSLDEVLTQFAMDVMTAIYGGEEPPEDNIPEEENLGLLDDYAIEFMEHMED